MRESLCLSLHRCRRSQQLKYIQYAEDCGDRIRRGQYCARADSDLLSLLRRAGREAESGAAERHSCRLC